MPAKQVLQNQSATFEIPAISETSSATVSVFEPDGTALVEDASATIDTTSATVNSQLGSSPETLNVSSVIGFVAGRPYLIESVEGPTSVLYLSSIDSANTRLIFDSPPPFAITNGDTVRGARVSYALASSHTSKRDLYYRAEFTLTPASGEVYKRQIMFHVCRMQFKDPVTLDDLKRVLSFQFPSSANAYNAGQLREMADRASQMVMRHIEASGRFPHLVSSPDAFKDAGLYALRLVLADDNLIPQAGTTELQEYVEGLRKALAEECRTAIKAGQWYDKNDNGKVDERETGAFSTRVLM